MVGWIASVSPNLTRFTRVRQVAFWAMVASLAVVALLAFYGSLSWIDRPYPGFKLRVDGSVELQLPPGSTGAQAGLRPGDRVVAVDGAPLGDPRTLYAEVAAKPLGTPITYDLVRVLPDGQTLRLKKQVATQAHDGRLWTTIFLALWLTGLSFLVLGVVVSVLKPGDPLARANLAFHLAGAAACFVIFDQSTTYLSPFQDPDKLLMWGIAVLFMNLALQFPRRYPGLEHARRLNWGVGLAGFAVLWGAGHVDRFDFWVANAHLGYIALAELVLVGNALWSSLNPKSGPEEQGQGKILLLGTLASTVPALLVPQAQSLGLQVNLEGLENFALPLWPLAISYAVLRHQLFDIRPLLSRSITYVSSAAVLTLLYVAATTATRAVIGSRTEVPGIVATVLVAFAFVPVRDRIQAWLDARFFRTAYRFDEVVAAFTRTAQSSVEPPVLMRAYLDALEGALAPTRVVIVVDGQHAASLGCTEAEGQALAHRVAPGSASVTWRDETLQVLPLGVQAQLLGHVLVGPKKSELAYTDVDRALLRELSQSLAVWLNLFERFEKVRRQTQELEALQRSEAMQGQFLNVVSHELKIPLSVIMSSLNILKRVDDTHDPKTRTHLNRIRRSLTQLTGLVGDLLNAGQLQSGHFQLRTGTVALDAIAHETLAEMRTLADQKEQALSLTVDASVSAVPGDAARLAQVLRNLLHNAIRYTPEKGRIRVALSTDDGHVRCEVDDTGHGIAPADVPHLFERFRQAHAPAADHDQGVGLGLFICKAIVEAHGGEIGVRSQPGVGSTFWFTLPVRA